MNKVMLIGRVSKDLELKYVPNSGKAVCSFTLAVDKFADGSKSAEFINCVCWDKIAENLANFQGKGSQIAVFGRLQTRSYDAKDGSKRFVTEVVATEITYLSKKNENKPTNPGMNFDDDMTPVDDGSDIPF